MVLTPSTMLELGTKLPTFSAEDVCTKKSVSSKDFAGKPLLVIFLCRHCPYVKHVEKVLAKKCEEYEKQGIAVVGISSNDIENYPDDAPESLAEQARLVSFTFPYLWDKTQAIAKAFRAACTPDFFLFNKKHELFYRGQFDDSRPGNGKPVTGADLTRAVQALLKHTAPPEPQVPSMGCNIKWRKGNEPDYFNG